MKAIMCLVYRTTWPELTYDAIDHYKYSVATVNTQLMLLGAPIGGEYFKGLQKFRPSASVLNHAWDFHHLCHTIGNYAVWPAGIDVCRQNIKRCYRYIDKYLQVIQQTLINEKQGHLDLKPYIYKYRKVYEPYRTHDGFVDMCRRMYLMGYLDDQGNVKSLFEDVWSDQKCLTSEKYYKALETYIDFCGKIIPKRSKQMVLQLMEVLHLSSPIVEQEDVILIQMPEGFTQLERLPDDPEESYSYGKVNEGSICYVQSYPIMPSETIPMDSPQQVIDRIHEALEDHQGLIEVINGESKYQKKYIYSIVKSAKETHGIIYIFTMHLRRRDKALCIRGTFEERGITGTREAMVYECGRNENLLKDDEMERWAEDPYDKDFKRGLLMNVSEKRMFDCSFPMHPLSELRELVKYIINNN